MGQIWPTNFMTALKTGDKYDPQCFSMESENLFIEETLLLVHSEYLRAQYFAGITSACTMKQNTGRMEASYIFDTHSFVCVSVLLQEHQWHLFLSELRWG